MTSLNNLDNTLSNIKTIVIEIEDKNKTSKQIKFEKEIKMRVETNTWGLNEEDLSHQTQLKVIKDLANNEKNKYKSLFINHIKTKISGYKQQDILKKRLDEEKIAKFNDVLKLLVSCELKCHYCSEEVLILYEQVRETKQWTLDRINNDIGHNVNNLLVACLKCNLKRRRTNKDKFMLSKNLVITREGFN